MAFQFVQDAIRYRCLFIGQILLAAVTALIRVRLREPATTSLQHALGAMRNIRTLGAVLGLGFFSKIFSRPCGTLPLLPAGLELLPTLPGRTPTQTIADGHELWLLKATRPAD